MSEEETRRLLWIRSNLEKRIIRLQAEVKDLKMAMGEIDKVIARQGFHRPSQKISEKREESGSKSIKAKNGSVLGSMQVEEREMIFTPVSDFEFTTSLPPFKSFLIDRVLANMRSSDGIRAEKGEILTDDILSYEISTEDERIIRLTVRNYGGERRLREIWSSIRWTFDKMQEKLGQS